MFDGRLVRLRAFEQTDLDANHAFMNDYATLRDMLSGLPFPASYEDERRWLDQQTSYTRGEYQFAIEDGGGLGRLFDIDVLDAGGKKLSREDLGLPPRKCLLCEQPAHACARSRTHTVMELTEQIESILRKEFSHHGI